MSIRVLIIDDSESKRAAIDHHIRGTCHDLDLAVACVEVVGSAADGLKLLKSFHFELVVLDLMLPLRHGGEPSSHGGTDLLSKIFTLKSVNVPEHIIALTAFEEIRLEQTQGLGAKAVAVVTFSVSSNEWKTAISSILQGMSARLAAASESYGVDLVVITALHLVELESILDLPAHWVTESFEFDPTVYHRGLFSRGAKSISVIASSPSHMGMPHAAALTMKLISRFRPRFVCMTGIAAGFKGAFGDILIPYNVWDYGSGKLVEISASPTVSRSGFLPRPYYIDVDPFVESRFHDFSLGHDEVLAKIWSSWKSNRPPHRPNVHSGTITSGASVVAQRDVINEIHSRNDKMVGLEMEIYGVFAAARMASPPAPRFFAIKSICDFGDGEKNDDYQRYAAYTSAQYLHEFALRYLMRGTSE